MITLLSEPCWAVGDGEGGHYTHEHAARAAARDLEEHDPATGRRYSPGICHWPRPCWEARCDGDGGQCGEVAGDPDGESPCHAATRYELQTRAGRYGWTFTGDDQAWCPAHRPPGALLPLPSYAELAAAGQYTLDDVT